ncbi:MAG: hypothetical protein L0Z07_09145 [Planctomycetes bacterium]|nr:hypothetical protein [Planctomycetota bacterium]
MFKRLFLAVTFLAAFTAAGVGMANYADAHGHRGGCYRGDYYGGAYHRGDYYRAYYVPDYGDWGYRPRVHTYYGDPSYWHYRHHDHSGMYFSIGF